MEINEAFQPSGKGRQSILPARCGLTRCSTARSGRVVSAASPSSPGPYAWHTIAGTNLIRDGRARRYSVGGTGRGNRRVT